MDWIKISSEAVNILITGAGVIAILRWLIDKSLGKLIEQSIQSKYQEQLEETKARFQKELEEVKKEYQKEVESFKTELLIQQKMAETTFTIFHSKRFEAVGRLYVAMRGLFSAVLPLTDPEMQPTYQGEGLGKCRKEFEDSLIAGILLIGEETARKVLQFKYFIDTAEDVAGDMTAAEFNISRAQHILEELFRDFTRLVGVPTSENDQTPDNK